MLKAPLSSLSFANSLVFFVNGQLTGLLYHAAVSNAIYFWHFLMLFIGFCCHLRVYFPEIRKKVTNNENKHSKRLKNISPLALFVIEVYNKLCYNHFIA